MRLVGYQERGGAFVKYLGTILAPAALLLLFAFPAWGQETTTSTPTATPEPTTASPEPTTTTPEETTAAPTGGNNGNGGGVHNPDKVIPDTTSKKPLPNTGGVPLLGLAIGVTALVGAGFSILRTSRRRDR